MSRCDHHRIMDRCMEAVDLLYSNKGQYPVDEVWVECETN
jgi:hypothetical protein